tara:strand:- start:53445 stop:55670 length:2226 start_codon:yes stop_codon:yes gene_type:complete
MPIDEDNREIIEEFVAESTETIGEVEAILVEMESGTCEADDDTLNKIFRAFHSVKGTAGFLELSNVVHVTHIAESLLDLLRRGELTLQPTHVSVFLRGLDCVNRALEEVAREGTDSCIADLSRVVGTALQAEIDGGTTSGDSPDLATQEVLIADLAALDLSAPLESVDVGAQSVSVSDADSDVDSDEDVDEEQALLEEFVIDSLERLDAVDASLAAARDGIVSQELSDEGLRALHTIKGNCGFLGFFALGELCHATETGLSRLVDENSTNLDAVFAAVDALRTYIAEVRDGGLGLVPNLQMLQDELEARSMTDVIVNADSAPGAVAQIRVADKTAKDLVAGNGPRIVEASSNQKQSIRVDTGKLDELMNLVGELIIAENMVSHNEDLEGHEFESFHKAALHLNRITRSLQDLTMSVRMVPIRPTFRKMLRVARDVARKQAKNIELILVGEGTEVDRSVVEAIGDPLVHLLRNAVDHGIEDATTRAGMGKPLKGQLHLSAHHEAGEVWIVLSDDGKGLDPDKILAKAIEKGVVENGDGLTNNEVFQLITEPGFSTADVLSDISGRGVGMDVVKRNIEKLRGRLEITSEVGKGTTFTLRIPLTLAIVEGMQVRVGDHSYTIPLFAIRESVAVEGLSVTCLTNGDEVLELRGAFIPILRMSTLHNIEADANTWDEGVLVIVSDAGFTMALFVDEVVGQRQTVVKPLPGYLGTMQGLAGCSILSTGKISLVVDVQTLTERVRLAA